MGLLFVNVVV